MAVLRLQTGVARYTQMQRSPLLRHSLQRIALGVSPLQPFWSLLWERLQRGFERIDHFKEFRHLPVRLCCSHTQDNLFFCTGSRIRIIAKIHKAAYEVAEICIAGATAVVASLILGSFYIK